MDIAPVSLVLVDDVEDLRVLLGLLFQRDPRFALKASVGDGPAALTAVETHRPDLLLLDLAMPGLDGLEVMERLTLLGPPQPAVIVLSGFDPRDAAGQAMSRGACGYIDKGLQASLVTDRVYDLWEARPAPAFS